MEYEALRELVRLITRHKAKDIELLGDTDEDGNRTKLNQLYDGIMRGAFISDDDAAADIYGSKANASHPEYRRLRNRLLRQLLNTTFFADAHQTTVTDLSKVTFQIYKDYAAATLLLSKDARQAGSYLMGQVVEMAIKYEFTELVAEGARWLRMVYAGSLGNINMLEKYTLIHEEYEKKRRLEIDAFNEYQYVVKHFIGGTSTNKAVFEHTTECFPRLLAKVDEVNTVNYFFYTYSLGIAHYSSVNDAKGALSICNQAIEVIRKKEGSTRGRMATFFLNKLHFLTQLRQFDESEANSTYQLSIEHTSEGETNWFKVQNIWVHYNLHAGHYQKAVEVYREVVSHPRYKLMTGLTAEIWKVYQGYFQLLVALGQLDEANNVGVFKAHKFVNEFQVLSRERTGMNIPVLILPVIFSLLSNEGIDGGGQSAEALDKYRQRYLQNEQNLRSAIFVKLLTALSKRSYTPKANQKIKLELENLANEPVETSGQSYAIEIIPYETLWALLDERVR